MLRIIVLTAVLLIILQNQVVLFTILLVNLIILLREIKSSLRLIILFQMNMALRMKLKLMSLLPG